MEVPEGLAADEIIQIILGPTAERIAMTFAEPEDYFEFWKMHPGLGPYWDDKMADYCRYDLEGQPGAYRAATSYDVARDDTVDLHSGTDILEALTDMKVATHFVTCPRGLFDQTPGLYSAERVTELLQHFTSVTHEEIADLNHYTIVMSDEGDKALASIINSRR